MHGTDLVRIITNDLEYLVPVVPERSLREEM